MPATHDRRVFGPKGQPGVEVPLPAIITADENKCFGRIFTVGAVDRASWYEFWEAMTAIWSVCARHGLGGFYSGLGDQSNLLASFTGSWRSTVSIVNATAEKNSSLVAVASKSRP
ncbi:hypothetical protein G7Y79_00057g090480 [Physcia stellaris]|nr:hypothetical protein G7Y79_00057g090480 [Physcia stellaris]